LLAPLSYFEYLQYNEDKKEENPYNCKDYIACKYETCVVNSGGEFQLSSSLVFLKG